MTNKEYEQAVAELTQRWINSKQESAEAKGLMIDDVDVYVNIEHSYSLNYRKKKFVVSSVKAKAFIIDSE